MKRRLRNLSKGKLAAALVVMCALVFGGYFGYHKFVVHADSKPTKQAVNTLADYNAMCESGKVDPTQEAGDKDNPFLILEITPYYGAAELGYLISGCEPLDFSDADPYVYRNANDFTRSGSDVVFEDEYQRDANDDGVPDEEWSDKWKRCEVTDAMKNNANDSYIVNGYYERVADGKPGDFVLDTGNNWEDTSKTTLVENEDGTESKAHPYRPSFKKVDDGSGQFIWVSLEYSLKGLGIKFDDYAKKENKTVTSKDASFEYKPGEREYTTRSLKDEDGYYAMVDTPKVGSGNVYDKNGVPQVHVVNMNDFMRTSLDLDDKSEAALLDFKLAVKVVEPKELAENPEWIDYADLVYIHEYQTVNSYKEWWITQRNKEGVKTRIKYEDSYYKDKEDSMTTKDMNSLEFTGKNDFGWNVAKKLFCKINQFEDYDGSGKYGFAPLLCSKVFIDNVAAGMGSTDVFNEADNTRQKVTNRHLDYATMEVTGNEFNENASNTGLYKFSIMNFLMDQENFYSYFFDTERDEGGKVITDDKQNNKGLCSPQENPLAQEWWNVHTFLPEADLGGTNVSKALAEKYDIVMQEVGSYMNVGVDKGLHGSTYFYNGDSLLSQGFNNANIPDNKSSKEAFDWFEDEYGERPDSLTPAQMVHYLLQYKRHGNDDDDVGTRDKETMHVLEIEPCADYIMTEKYLTGKYLPASRFSGKIEVDHMTTAEFNSLRRDINGYYDLIYIGDNIGKFNTEDKSGKTSTTHNDSKLDGYVYIHVGDQADDSGKLRFSGDDISKVKKTQLQKYVSGGNALVLADTLAINSQKTDAYASTYSKAVDLTSNMHALLNSLKSANEGVQFKKGCVTSLSDLSVKFLSTNCLKYMNKGYALPKKAKTTMTTKQYKEFTKAYQDYVGLYSKITSTPARWYDRSGLKDDDEINSSTGTKDSVQELVFKFRIGDQTGGYAGKLYIDLNGDGVITDDELVQDTFANNAGSPWYYVGEEAKDASGNVYKDKTGAAVTVPGEQTYTYDKDALSSNKRFYLNKTKKPGAITWKFVLYDITTKENYQAVTGTSRYSKDGKSADDTSDDSNKTEIKAYQILDDGKAGSDANLENQLTNGGLFQDYTKNTDFKVSVKSVELKEFITELEAGNIGTTTSGEDYNCYVVSCGSTIFKNANYAQAAKFLADKAKTGVSVVFTGEALNDQNKSDDVKNVLNMSRFTADKTYGDIKDKATSPTKEYEDTSKMEYTYAKVMKQGSTGKKKAYKNSYWKKNYGTNPGKTTAVCRNNKGRYTTYPYNIDKTFTAAEVAAQDYQLNMDNEALTVWYSLGPDGEGDDTEYGISPRDGANNYYLYSVSNVIYDLIDLENVSDPMEMKLFINVLSGNVVSPLVTVDSGKTIDSGYGEVTIDEVTSSYFNTEDIKRSEDGADMTVYQGKIVSTGSDYEDYRQNSKKVKGDGTGTGGRIDDVDPTPIPATPTPAPVKQPQKLSTIQSNTFEIGRGQKNNIFKGWDDDAVVVVEYKTTTQYHGASTGNTLIYSFWKVGDQSWQDKQLQESDTNGISPNIVYDEETLCRIITIGDLKKMYGVTSGDMTSMKISGSHWAFTISMVGVFTDEAQYNDYKKGKIKFADTDAETGSVDTGESIIEADATKVGSHKEASDAATKRSWIPDTATHRIFFTPYTNATDSKNVYSFKISRITASINDLGTSKEKTVGDYVDTVFRKVDTATGNYVWKFTANKDTHMFTISDDNFLSDRTQYYFYTTGTDINALPDPANTGDKTKWIRFDISNRRKSAISYLHLFYDGNVDTTYLFDLD